MSLFRMAVHRFFSDNNALLNLTVPSMKNILKLLQLVTNVLYLERRNFASAGFNRFESRVEVGETKNIRSRCFDPVINFDMQLLERDVLQDTTMSSLTTYSSEDSNARLLEELENSGLFLTR